MGGVNSWLPVCCAYVFFVLSGFLAGFRLNTVDSLSVYYKKKAKRILPQYYIYIVLAIIAFIALGRGSEVLNAWLGCYVLPVPNIPFCNGHGILPVVHLWFIGSLVTFYLVFPLICRVSGNKILKTSVIIAVCWALAKWGLYAFVGKGTFIYKYWGCAGMDCLFGGVALGILVRDGNRIIQRISESKWIAVIAWVLFLASGLYGNFIPSACRVEYIAIITCLLILSQLPMTPIVNLDNKVCDWLGGISYEIYVMQILVIILLDTLYAYLGLHWHIAVIYFAVTAIVIAVAWGMNRLMCLLVYLVCR